MNILKLITAPTIENSANPSPAIILSNVCLNYDSGCVLHEINGEFAPNSLTAIVGPNGAGKTSLIKAILGLLPLHTGQIEIHNCSAHEIGYLPQLNEFERSFPLSVFDLVAMGLWSEIGIFSGISCAQEQRMEDAINAAGLQGYEDTLIGALSAGQLKRALFARLLVQNPKLVIMDEPFAAMDTDTCRFMMQQMQKWQGQGKTILAVVHDIALAAKEFPRTLLLARKQIAWGGSAQVLQPDKLLQAYQTFDKSMVIA